MCRSEPMTCSAFEVDLVPNVDHFGDLPIALGAPLIEYDAYVASGPGIFVGVDSF